MRTFNKVVAVLGLLLLFLLLPVIAAVPSEILSLLRDALGADTALTTGARVAVLAVAAVLWVAVVVLLWLEFRPSRSGTIRVAAVEGGSALVQSRSVERRVEQALLSLPSVQAAQARVQQTRSGVVATLSIDSDEDVNVPDLTSSSIGRARYLLEKEVGASVARVNVSVRHVAPKPGRAARSAMPSPRAQAPGVPAAAAPRGVAPSTATPAGPSVTAAVAPAETAPPVGPRTEPAVSLWTAAVASPAPTDAVPKETGVASPVAFEAAVPEAPLTSVAPAPLPPAVGPSAAEPEAMLQEAVPPPFAEPAKPEAAAPEQTVVPPSPLETAETPDAAAAAVVEEAAVAAGEPVGEGTAGGIEQGDAAAPDEDDAHYYEPEVPDWRAADGEVQGPSAQEECSGDGTIDEAPL